MFLPNIMYKVVEGFNLLHRACSTYKTFLQCFISTTYIVMPHLKNYVRKLLSFL